MKIKGKVYRMLRKIPWESLEVLDEKALKIISSFSELSLYKFAYYPLCYIALFKKLLYSYYNIILKK